MALIATLIVIITLLHYGAIKGNIGLHDMKLCVEAAKDVPAEIAF